MYNIETIADLIEGANLGTKGVDIFLYSAPADMKNGMIIFPSNDPPIIDPYLPEWRKGKFQIIVRNPKYEDGITLSKSISDFLTIFNEDTPNINIRYIRPLYEVRVYRRSDSGLIEFSVNYEIRYTEK